MTMHYNGKRISWSVGRMREMFSPWPSVDLFRVGGDWSAEFFWRRLALGVTWHSWSRPAE